MSFPKNQTVGDLMDYLQKQLDEGKITRGTSVFIEMYAMTAEDSILKEHQEELDYHIPDDINDEMFSFTTGVWSGPACPRKDGAAYVALSCYLTNRRLDQNTQREIKIDGEMTRAYDFGILGGLGVMGLTIAFFHGTSGSSLGQLNFYIFDSFLQGVAEGGRLKGNAELAEYNKSLSLMLAKLFLRMFS